MFKKNFKITKSTTDRTTESTKKYFSDVKKYKYDESELYDDLLAGDEKAIDKLIIANSKFVVSVANKYVGRGLSLNDLINEGNYGLIVAARRFDPRHGVKFISFAVSYIRKYIMKAIDETAYSAPIPPNRVNEINQFRKFVDQYEQEMGQTLTLNDSLSMFSDDFSKDTIITYFSIYGRTSKSLNDKAFGEDQPEEMISFLVDDSENVLDRLDKDNLVKRLHNVINKLDEKERLFVRLKFGDANGFTHKEAEIKKMIGLSQKKYEKFVDNTMNKIRKELN